MFTKKEKKVLLQLARKSLKYYLDTKAPYSPEDFLEKNLTKSELRKVYLSGGVFVTLEKKGRLRGCIGIIESNLSLYKNIVEYAVNAGLRDSRFPPVKKEELKDIEFEISVLSKPKKIDSMDEIVIGKHGVILTKGYNRAVFLPQVAPEWGWDTTELLRHLSEKAGLSADAYKSKGIVLEVFEAEVFNEGDMKPKIKEAEYAGSFYPKDSKKLDTMLEYFIKNVRVGKKYSARAIIAPHAGYVYSGKTAIVPYKLLRANKKVETVVVFAPSHNYDFDKVAYSDYDFFKTPLGKIEVDKEVLEKVKKFSDLTKSNKSFHEHSLEVHIPFIQRVFGKEVKILPFIVGDVKSVVLSDLLKELWIEKHCGFVFSTDLSHFLSRSECMKVDNKTIKMITNLEYDGLDGYMACGHRILKGALKFAKKKNLKVLKVSQADSSEYSGDTSRVVGYAGFVFTK